MPPSRHERVFRNTARILQGPHLRHLRWAYAGTVRDLSLVQNLARIHTLQEEPPRIQYLQSSFRQSCPKCNLALSPRSWFLTSTGPEISLSRFAGSYSAGCRDSPCCHQIGRQLLALEEADKTSEKDAGAAARLWALFKRPTSLRARALLLQNSCWQLRLGSGESAAR